MGDAGCLLPGAGEALSPACPVDYKINNTMFVYKIAINEVIKFKI